MLGELDRASNASGSSTNGTQQQQQQQQHSSASASASASSSTNATGSRAPPLTTPQQRRGLGSGSGSGSTQDARGGGTSEQVSAVRVILRAKDHYEVLGVERGCTSAEVKRAYRKLALTVHPDKCAAPGAEDAFKSVGKAFAVLSDDQKRAYYDQTGAEDPREAAAQRREEMFARGGGGGFRREMTPEEIFQSFFGGMDPWGDPMMNMGGARVYTFGGGRGPFDRRRGQRMRQGRGPMRDDGANAGFVQMLPLLMIVFLSILSNLRWSEDPLFQLHKRGAYAVVRETERLEAKYYVKADGSFDRHLNGDSRKFREVELQVERAWLDSLATTCSMRGGASCTRYQKFRTKFFASDEPKGDAASIPGAAS